MSQYGNNIRSHLESATLYVRGGCVEYLLA